ncbi:alpha/beta-hydrolase [Eremomyces bilateralis CBS 781.70]|uniref:Alpha/beta-hydrolase n=1 Tax=Eremomyces bilateralis CBS 781.70 TaxID=1392243 RepID=A0A6G1G1U4_9PEZI|nr:alpha/beta-hydrolase [Eremomyces bilateralis CBS 781.70]KAF1811896.1 alpha/beta-hydrolase [Eremomyces bilateralis CBS 781.70]
MLAPAFLLLFQTISASSIHYSRGNHGSSKRTNGFCKQLDIPVTATSESAIYDVPRVDNDIEAAAWAIYSDTWSTPDGVERIIKNTTTSGTFNIHAQLCVPKTSGEKKDILQIATHGAHYDGRYWDPELDREKQSYVEASIRAGYSILTYDRLGTGQSDHPDAYDVVQAPLELEILRQLTLMARDGSLSSFAEKAKPSDEAFQKLPKPSKVVHVGHSFGSFITSAFIAKYSNLTDGAIITGFLLGPYLGKPGMASWAAEYAATGNPPFERPSGYMVCQEVGIQNLFFAGDPKTAFTPAMLKYGNDIKQPVPVGEFASAFHILGLPGPNLKAPVQYVAAEFDFYICGGDCKGLYDVEDLKKTYPNATTIEVAIQPNTGHAFTLHNNATAGFQLTFDFLGRNGL